MADHTPRQPPPNPAWRAEALACLARCPGTLWLAYSGGGDSSVLLHLVAHSPLAERTVAVHVHHGLQGEADAWAIHCRRQAHGWGVGFRLLKVEVPSGTGQGIEGAARSARYRALGGLLGPDDALVTAHHRDDQAETLLLRLLRGAGPTGLAAMAEARPLARGQLLRPLLPVPRGELVAYAAQVGLVAVADPSNAALHFDRNYLRHRVIPPLAARWPQWSRTAARAAVLLAETNALLAELAQEDLVRCRTPRPDALALAPLAALSAPRRRLLVRHWLAGLGLPPPGHGHLAALDRDVNPEVHGLHLQWPGGRLRSFGGHVYAVAPSPGQDTPWPDECWPCTLDAQGGLAVALPPALGVLTGHPCSGKGLARAKVAAAAARG
ncbi:MAG: tRNA lysidine(34) synthetase TilS, partial [Candidatus Competibacterales bacterium]